MISPKKDKFENHWKVKMAKKPVPGSKNYIIRFDDITFSRIVHRKKLKFIGIQFFLYSSEKQND